MLLNKWKKYGYEVYVEEAKEEKAVAVKQPAEESKALKKKKK